MNRSQSLSDTRDTRSCCRCCDLAGFDAPYCHACEALVDEQNAEDDRHQREAEAILERHRTLHDHHERERWDHEPSEAYVFTLAETLAEIDAELDEAFPSYLPTSAECAIAKRYPELRWLVELHPRRRRWHAHHDRVLMLVSMFEGVPEDVFVELLRPSFRSGT